MREYTVGIDENYKWNRNENESGYENYNGMVRRARMRIRMRMRYRNGNV